MPLRLVCLTIDVKMIDVKMIDVKTHDKKGDH